MRLNRGKSPPYRPWMFEIVLIAIIADPTAPVYSFQARRPPTRMPREIASELTGHGLPLSKCEAYNRGC